jgi:hypothetical protein
VRLPVSLAQQRPLQLCTRPWSAHIHVARMLPITHTICSVVTCTKGVDSRREHVRTSSSWRRVRTRRRTAEGELRAMVRARLRAWGNTWLFSTASSTTPNLAASSPVNVSPVCQSGLLPRNQPLHSSLVMAVVETGATYEEKPVGYLGAEGSGHVVRSAQACLRRMCR